ncbi:hypothetical protein EVAR_459_1 [Eumeta japonica]|uniref:Uncharacterized protein n=1 Tax=Eumeta variegata TaxID=151549 RepID=A0A4C1SDG6_EUMVA|nr:hypothetical protein EVAR_459_1 [Eumeta japonica]
MRVQLFHDVESGAYAQKLLEIGEGRLDTDPEDAFTKVYANTSLVLGYPGRTALGGVRAVCYRSPHEEMLCCTVHSHSLLFTTEILARVTFRSSLQKRVSCCRPAKTSAGSARSLTYEAKIWFDLGSLTDSLVVRSYEATDTNLAVAPDKCLTWSRRPRRRPRAGRAARALAALTLYVSSALDSTAGSVSDGIRRKLCY